MGRSNQRRYNIREAAETLGVSSEAVRMRVKRGTLASEKGEDGRTYVRLNAEPTESGEKTQHTDHALIEQLRSENSYLREQLEEANTRDRENRRLLAAALERMPELEAQEAAVAPQRASEGTDRGEAAEEPTEPRSASPDTVAGGRRPGKAASWWRRLLGR